MSILQLDLDWRSLATTCPVTGILNRLALELELQHRNKPYVIFMLDLNKFKPINDTAGHKAGDKVLKAIAQSLRTSCGDSVYRCGGDEFVALVECSSADIPGIYHRLKAAVLSTSLDEYLPESMSNYRCDVAIGAACSEEEDAMELADHRMYADKKLSKACR